MNRRSFLASLLVAPAAIKAIVASQPSTTVGTKPAEDAWQIVFPDGSAWCFAGTIVGDEWVEGEYDAIKELVLRPKGPIEFFAAQPKPKPKRRRKAIAAVGTMVMRNTIPIAELQDITMPSIRRVPIDVTVHEDSNGDLWEMSRLGPLEIVLNFVRE